MMDSLEVLFFKLLMGEINFESLAPQPRLFSLMALLFKVVLKSTRPVIQLLSKHLLLVYYQECTVDKKKSVPDQYTNAETIIVQK